MATILILHTGISPCKLGLDPLEPLPKDLMLIINIRDQNASAIYIPAREPISLSIINLC